MKKIFSISLLAILGITSCTKKQFEDSYSDPSKLSSTTVDRQFAGMLSSNLNYVMYRYYAYFAVYQNTMMPWSQTAATLNSNGRYIPGAAATSDVWSTYYKLLAQYKEMLRLYNAASKTDQQTNRMYYIAATTYFYDFTQKMVDIWGDIPWSGAGLLSANGGNYQASAAKYDDAATIYTKMLDDLKGFADELNTISVSSGIAAAMKTQDFVNHGDVVKWKKYCNSLRIRMLSRVNGVAAFQSRVNSEMASILGNATNYPIVTTNSDNIMVKVVNNTTGINNGTNTGSSSDFYRGLIGWQFADRAGKVMIDTMNNNTDPRLRAMFEPGDSAQGVYMGLDPSLTSTDQNTILNKSLIATYNRSTLSQNIFLPGTLINAAEIDFLIAEYYLNANNDASARTAYEAGITQSVNYYYWLRTLSGSSISGALTPLGSNEISNYLSSPGVLWTNATTSQQKLNKIAVQKWINFSVLQPMECWSELRRLKLPALTFVPDAGIQKLPPTRWLYPTDEQTYNAANYQAVQAKDNLSTKIFWDVR
ncbi:SusD/RagB family nutrient-binding outer membrane lipoprotein [Asinibacterium sp. OR53]|uniref:SusD/RagB family nutrient-binding outer membrane lipoprotein n=1 Tax=Asinibacterium sp. OR53 TaxID=925409 RepID=UPI00047A14F8|nr:SusD/RagB family nutrient-binding outer membrane lipoprotein [Asinibacterium sp. OR53]